MENIIQFKTVQSTIRLLSRYILVSVINIMKLNLKNVKYLLIFTRFCFYFKKVTRSHLAGGLAGHVERHLCSFLRWETLTTCIHTGGYAELTVY